MAGRTALVFVFGVTALVARTLASVPVAQDREKLAVPFAQIYACVMASDCKNMRSARVSAWADVGPPMGMVFEDGGMKYELSMSVFGRRDQPRNLDIMTTFPGETRPGQLITFDSTGTLVSASLGRPAGEPAVFRGTSQELEAAQKRRKMFNAAPLSSPGTPAGAEFKPFWQERADLALAAVARVLTR
ncbi:MAG TPA: hypothetical protein VFV78_14610 [Vicinamibacterales bacterium]|nr:hypothetical protein [Vicinamibacterales bacterium]